MTGNPSLRMALEALARAKARHASARPHRALVRVEGGAYLVQALVLPALFCGLLLWGEPLLIDFWRAFVLTWAQYLELPLRASARAAGSGELRLVWGYFETDSLVPGSRQLVVHALVTVAAFASTFAMRSEMLPVKYGIRVLCALHATAIAWFAAPVAEFPYDVTDHILALTRGGFVLLLMVPPMLAMGYYVLRIPLTRKIFHSVLFLGYFFVLVPLEVVIHVVLLRYLSIVVMPLLFFAFGTLLNFVVFIALYAWAASIAGEEATAPARVTAAG